MKYLIFYKIKFLDLEKYVFQKILIANCKEFPIRVSSKEKSFEILVDYIIFLNRLNPNQPINDYVPNSHLIQQFEEIIDAMVYELYFEEDFKKADIEFIKYVERDFPSIDGLKSEKVKQVIHESYQRLRQKENELRNNLKLMDIRLRDLIMPIKTAH